MSDFKGILVFAEIVDGKLSSVAAELLGCARGLAGKFGENVSAVVMGSGISALAQEAIAFGADKVYVVDAPFLKNYQADAYIKIMENLVNKEKPRVVLFGQTSVGRDLVPRLAFRLGVPAAMDCIELKVDETKKVLETTRPVYGGNARAIFTSEQFPQVASVRPKTMSALEKDASRKGEVITMPPGVDESIIKAKTLEKVKEEVAGIKLEDAQTIVTGGRGIGGPDGFKLLDALAKVLGAAVGATRPPCDNNWVPANMQIGLTGKIVTPTLYITVGVSGASQHMAGCSGARNIIAINKDPEANIFKEARFGIVGDWKQALPAFTTKCKELLEK